MDIHPPFLSDKGYAPGAVCSRWTGDSPCGAIAAFHVVWDRSMTNGLICRRHADEVRANWCYVGLHPYEPACDAAGRALWLVSEDRCVLPDAATPTVLEREGAL